ncbi:tetratricopeptide repeat protein [Desulfoglaeba alkanexedens]|uniref:tetratricopeptide repeat protein n=1 Tax=Desulfoglaeba alkanexedens TaxID=361111 RepID=UPI001476D77A|nr:tetratricopeptide repeat protein [Desulfoglaeba alkanexedens]
MRAGRERSVLNPAVSSVGTPGAGSRKGDDSGRPSAAMSALLVFLALAAVGCFGDPESRFRRLDEKAAQACERGDFPSALRTWRKALELKPQAWHVLLKIGRCHEKLGAYPEALDAFRQAVGLAPEAAEARRDLTRLLMATGNLPEAWRNLQWLLERYEDDARVQTLAGDLHVLGAFFNEAAKAYAEALALAPDDPAARIKLASCLAALGDMERAEEVFSRLERLDPDDPELLSHLAHYWDLRGDAVRAERCLTAAVQNAPGDPAFRRRLVEFYHRKQRYDEALDELRRLQRQTPGVTVLRKLEIEILLATSRYGEAEEVLQGLNRAGHKDLELKLLEGKLRLLKDERIAAVSAFETVVDWEPDLPVAHYLLGLAYLRGNQVHLARKSLIRALTLDHAFSDAELVLAGVFYKLEEYDLAEQHLRRLCEREPENVNAQLLLGATLLASGRLQEARTRFMAARRLVPEAPEPLFFLALERNASGHAKEARECFEAFLERRPVSADAGLRLAELLLSEVGGDGAVRTLEQLIQRAPNSGYLYHVLGETWAASGRVDAAKAAFIKAVELEPSLACAYGSMIRIGGDDPAEKERLYLRCIRSLPHFTSAYNDLALFYRRQGRIQDAVNVLEEALKRDPHSPVTANNLAWMYLEEGLNEDRALGLAQSAFDRFPEDPDVMDTLAWAYFKRNLYSRSLWLLTEAAKGKPADPTIHYHLGRVYQAKGDWRSAEAALRKALESELDAATKLEATKALAEVEQRLSDEHVSGGSAGPFPDVPSSFSSDPLR